MTADAIETLAVGPPPHTEQRSGLPGTVVAACRLPETISHAIDPGWVPTPVDGPSATGDVQQGHLTQTWLAVSGRPLMMDSSRSPICGGEDCGSQFLGVSQCDQVPAGDDDGVDPESFAGQLLLELHREEAVVSA